MKKLIVLLLCAVLITVGVVPAFANDSNAPLLIEQYKSYITYGHPENITDEQVFQYNNYRELYHHYSDGELDWALVHAGSAGGDVSVLVRNFDRVYWNGDHSIPFWAMYGVYDAADETFYDLAQLSDTGKYAGLKEVMIQLNIGIPVGDANFDGALSIDDATEIQRYLAEYITLNVSDVYTRYIADIDLDGRVDIKDVTEIQRYLAGFINKFPDCPAII